MKKFEIPAIDELDVSSTAFGPNDPNSMDTEKTAVTDSNGNVLGWKEQFGEKLS